MKLSIREWEINKLWRSIIIIHNIIFIIINPRIFRHGDDRKKCERLQNIENDLLLTQIVYFLVSSLMAICFERHTAVRAICIRNIYTI